LVCRAYLLRVVLTLGCRPNVLACVCLCCRPGLLIALLGHLRPTCKHRPYFSNSSRGRERHRICDTPLESAGPAPDFGAPAALIPGQPRPSERPAEQARADDNRKLKSGQKLIARAPICDQGRYMSTCGPKSGLGSIVREELSTALDYRAAALDQKVAFEQDQKSWKTGANRAKKC
jgi:hypothetical protein